MNANELHRLKANIKRSHHVIGAHHAKRAAITLPLLKKNNEYHFLFEQRTPHIAQGGEICFPGGMFEADGDDSIEDTAVRETSEELGINRNLINILGNLGNSVTLRGIIVACFPAEITIDSLNELTPDRSEVERIFTLPVEWFRTHSPREYRLHVELHPKITDKNGNEKILFPAEELDLPVKYHNSWVVNKQRVIVYDAPEGVIWGMTAAVIEEFLYFLKH